MTNCTCKLYSKDQDRLHTIPRDMQHTIFQDLWAWLWELGVLINAHVERIKMAKKLPSSVFYQHPKLTHKQEVTRLYRHSLKNLLWWVVRRDLWREQALDLRERFEANKDERDVKKVKQILEEGKAEFERKKHPFPYIGKFVYTTCLFMVTMVTD